MYRDSNLISDTLKVGVAQNLSEITIQPYTTMDVELSYDSSILGKTIIALAYIDITGIDLLALNAIMLTQTRMVVGISNLSSSVTTIRALPSSIYAKVLYY